MGVFSKLAGGSVAKTLGIVLMVLTIIPGIFKTCSVTVHEGEVGYLLWRGKAITHGHFMYPLRDFMRRLFRMERRPRYVYPPKPRYTGRHWYVPILSRYQVENTANREHVTTIVFTRYDEEQQCWIIHTVEAQLVWGQNFQPIVNPFYVPRNLNVEDMAIALRDVEAKVGKLKGDIMRLIHEPFIYPWGALFNGVHYEALSLGLMKRAVFEVLSDPAFPVESLRDSDAVFEQADTRCQNRLLLLYASDFRELHLSDVSQVPMQTGQVAAAIRSLNSNGTSTGRGMAQRVLRGVAAFLKSS